MTVSAAFFAISFPVAVSPVSETRRDRRVADERVADGNAVPGHDLQHAGRQHLLCELDEAQHRQRRLLGGLDDLDVARRERRPHLPDRHEERVVPGADPRDDPEGLAADHRRVALDVLRGGLPLEVPRRAREEAQVVRHDARLVDRDPPRLADVLRLEARQLLCVLVDQVGELQEQLHPVLRCLPAPLVPRRLRRGDRALDVLRRATGHLRDHLAGRRVEHLHRLARRRVDELAADEHLVLGHGNAHGRSSGDERPICVERTTPSRPPGTPGTRRTWHRSSSGTRGAPSHGLRRRARSRRPSPRESAPSRAPAPDAGTDTCRRRGTSSRARRCGRRHPLP